MKLAQRWATDCHEYHSACNLKRPPRYPTRLLSIATDPIQLVVTTEWTDRPLYATLSHCWGSSTFETLNSTNVEELKQRVPSRFLVKTFADAIQIARNLGLNYLWIDSLCIIQDNSQDWEVEASIMASVYGGSSLNIAASFARDGTEGCFLKTRHYGGGFTAGASIAGKRQMLELSPGNEYYRNVTGTHLATRAWTVQEKILAPRTLHCGDQGFFFGSAGLTLIPNTSRMASVKIISFGIP